MIIMRGNSPFHQEIIFFSIIFRIFYLRTTSPHVTSPKQGMVALLRPRCDNTTRHRPRPPPSSDSHHPNVKKVRSGFKYLHYEFLDPQLLVSVIATEFHGPSNHSKSSILALLKPDCDVTQSRAPVSSGCKKINFRSDLGPPHY